MGPLRGAAISVVTAAAEERTRRNGAVESATAGGLTAGTSFVTTARTGLARSSRRATTRSRIICPALP